MKWTSIALGAVFALLPLATSQAQHELKALASPLEAETFAHPQISADFLAPRPGAKTFGGASADIFVDSAQARGGRGFFLCGNTLSFGQGGQDAWVVALDGSGAAKWETAIGGPLGEQASAVLGTQDSGCIVAGFAGTALTGGQAGWIVKLNKEGAVEWQRSYALSDRSSFVAIEQSPNGFYVGGNILDGSGEHDIWILEINSSGDVLWQKTIPGQFNDLLSAITATPDGLIVTVNSRSQFSGLARTDDIPFFRPWAIRLDAKGDVLWSKTYNFSGSDAWADIARVKEGGFIATGELIANGFFRGDLWLVRLDEDGNVLWNRTLGNNFGVTWVDSGAEVVQTPDGGFLALGSTGTAGAGSEDLWLVKVNSNGEHEWDQTYGDVGFDNGLAMTMAGRWSILIAGFMQVAPAPAPVDGVAIFLRLDGSAGPGCDLSSPTSPFVGDPSPLSVASVNVATVSTLGAVAPTGALATALDSDSVLCGPDITPQAVVEEREGENPHDLNGDSLVDSSDLVMALGAFGTDNDTADFNRDGRVDSVDLGIIARQLCADCP